MLFTLPKSLLFVGTGKPLLIKVKSTELVRTLNQVIQVKGSTDGDWSPQAKHHFGK